MTGEQDPTTAHLTASAVLKPAIHAWTYYLDDQGNSQHTVKAFAADMRLLAGFLPPDQRLEEISSQDLNQFLEWMQKRRGVPCSPKTLSRRITSLKAFFRWLREKGVLDSDPAEPILQRSVISPLPVILTEEETQAVITAADARRSARKSDLRYITLLQLLLETGIKKSECLAMHPNHIEAEGEEGPFLFVRYVNPQYRYKERKIPLTSEWISIYEGYRKQISLSDKVFPWSQRRLEYLLEDLSRDAALEKHLSFDMCRWTCAVRDWHSGMDANKIRQKLGISKIQWREVGMKLARLSGDAAEETAAGE